MERTFTGNYNSSMTSNSGLNSAFQPNIDLLRTFPKSERSYQTFAINTPTQFPQREEFLPTEHIPPGNPNRQRETGISTNGGYPQQQTNLEKLFSHATEVKGDLESVINALVGIIGPSKNESTVQSEQDTVLINNSIETHTVNHSNLNFHPNQYGSQTNFNWTNKITPSVNVENVLKIVRANKINKVQRQRRYDSSQSSESSKEKVPEKMEYPINAYEYNMTALLNDPIKSEGRNQAINVAPNRRRYKSKGHSSSNANGNWVPSDIYVKRSKSIKSGSEIGTDFVSGQVSSIITESPHNPREPTDACSHWISSVNHPAPQVLSDPLPRELFNIHNQEIILPGSERLDPTFYNQQPTYAWSPNKEVSTGHDESSCSSFSIWSQNQMMQHQNRGVIRNCYDRNICKKTPSVSVSDSEGSTEPPSPLPVKRIPRLPSLGTQLRGKEGQYELLLINQPEQHHRARYMTEGSRGAVKDRSGNGFPMIQLIGWKKPATLQIFVGTEDGRVKPHSFYQACKVSGKQIHSCKERMFDGTGLIEIQIESKESQSIVLDCIGILKLRNVDVERRAGIQRVKLKSTMARLVFRVNLPHGDGFFTCLQVTSDPILCTQPVGSPEICKMSLCEGSCKGNMELFIIGKNIIKSCKVLFQDYSEHKGVIWQEEARIDVEYLHQSHLICTVPPYCVEHLRTPVTVQVVITCNGRLSEPRYFTYLPDAPAKPLDTVNNYEMEEWKMLKSDYNTMPTFHIENCSLTSELSNPNCDDTFVKSNDDMIFDKEYNKSKLPSFSHQLFPPTTNPTNYNPVCSSNKPLDHPQTRMTMDWLPCTTSNDISISSISTPSSFEAMSNSLDSNIQNDFMLHFSSSDTANMSNNLSESLNTLTESNDILTNL